MSDKSDDKLKGKAAIEEIGLRLDGMLGNLKGAIEEISRRVRDAGYDPDGAPTGRAERGDERPGDVEIETPAGPVRATASIRVRTIEDVLDARAGAGEDRTQRGPVKAAAANGGDVQFRDCAAEIFEEADGATITAELPGVAEEDVSITIADGALRLETAGRRRFRGEVALPEGLDPEGRTHSLRNGILEIWLPKAGA